METGKDIRVWLLLLLGTFGRVTAMGDRILEISQQQNIIETHPLWLELSKLLALIKGEFDFAYTLIWRGHQVTCNACIFDILIQRLLESPSMIIHSDQEPSELSTNHPQTVLTMSCWESVWNSHILDIVASNSTHSKCHLIWLDDSKKLEDICALMVNVTFLRHFIIDRKSMVTQSIHACDQGLIRTGNYSNIHQLLSLSNRHMVGLPIVTESDQLAPRSIIYYDSNGSLQLEGLFGNCIKTFAERHGAKLIITPPLELRKVIYYGLLENKTFEGLLDLAACATPFQADHQYSYPLELMESCYMIPLPRMIEPTEVFIYIIELNILLAILLLALVYGILFTIATRKSVSAITLADVVLNDRAVRVLLGQSFVMPAKPCLFMQYMCFLSCYTSLIITTSYMAYLQSQFIHPSLQQRVESYEDVEKSGLKIKVTPQELKLTGQLMDTSSYARYRHLFEVMTSFDEYVKLRDSMDTRYMYSVSKIRWEVFSEQQKWFQRPVFFFSQNLCLEKRLPLSIPFRPNLPYKEMFNQHLHDVRDTGLLQYWVNDNFYVMVRLNYMEFEDLSTTREYPDEIDLHDFELIWIFYGVMLALSVIVFASELLYYRR